MALPTFPAPNFSRPTNHHCCAIEQLSGCRCMRVANLKALSPAGERLWFCGLHRGAQKAANAAYDRAVEQCRELPDRVELDIISAECES